MTQKFKEAFARRISWFGVSFVGRIPIWHEDPQQHIGEQAGTIEQRSSGEANSPNPGGNRRALAQPAANAAQPIIRLGGFEVLEQVEKAAAFLMWLSKLG